MAAPFLALSTTFNIIGIVIMAIIASITMMANSSIRVKALFNWPPPQGNY